MFFTLLVSFIVVNDIEDMILVVSIRDNLNNLNNIKLNLYFTRLTILNI